MTNLVHAREVKTFNLTFTGAFTSPQVIPVNYYWRDKNFKKKIKKKVFLGFDLTQGVKSLIFCP
jgi:hypothetical protein